ncbi:acyl-CoA thioesterase [Empedobacter sedimenti]|uniref:acyl-CoA thioesterase n=1 Tax=Empedobacter sedimenti TaxID=3042610 RepID=UPI0024A66F3B|nr:acyl-CoA thioesterase [Empedobacter sedimenti]
MKNTYFQKTSVRWSDLDANRHLANASYMNFTSFARIAFLRDYGVAMQNLAEYGIGPAILHEQFSFFKEAMEGEDIYITVEIGGMSEDGMIYQFIHNLYNQDGVHLCHSELTGVWFSMSKRKMQAPPTEMLENIKKSFEGKTVKTLSKQDIINLPFRSENVDPSIFTQK